MKQYTDQLLKIRHELYRMVEEESDRQLEKWGLQTHSGPTWATISMEEVGEVAKAILNCEFEHGSRFEVRAEAIQAASLFLKIAEMYDAEPVVSTVYLAGPIMECSDSEVHNWRDEVIPVIKGKCIDPSRLTPAQDFVNIDKADIASCQVVLANCWKPSPGTSMEIFIANQMNKKVVTVTPRDQVSRWIVHHSDVVFHSLAEAVEHVNQLMSWE